MGVQVLGAAPGEGQRCRCCRAMCAKAPCIPRLERHRTEPVNSTGWTCPSPGACARARATLLKPGAGRMTLAVSATGAVKARDVHRWEGWKAQSRRRGASLRCRRQRRCSGKRRSRSARETPTARSNLCVGANLGVPGVRQDLTRPSVTQMLGAVVSARLTDDTSQDRGTAPLRWHL